MIGLVDLDLQTSTSTSSLIPNLEIMKLANYYQSEEQKFCRLIDLEDHEVNGYEKIFIFSEATKPIVPAQFLRTRNVILGGTGFTRGVYQPFENSLIDFMLPRTSIYKEFLQQKIQDDYSLKVINSFLDNTYYRMYADDEKLPLPMIKINKRVIIYDKNFFVPNWETIIDTISDRRPARIFTVHPIICSTIDQFLQIRQKQKISRSNIILLRLAMKSSEWYYLFKEYKNKLLAEITPTSEVYLELGGNFKTNTQFYANYIYILNLLYTFWSHQIPIRLKVQPSLLGITNPIFNLEKITETWSNMISASKHKKETCLKDKIFRLRKKTIEYQEYLQLLKFQPHIESLITQTYQKIITGGVWRI